MEQGEAPAGQRVDVVVLCVEDQVGGGGGLVGVVVDGSITSSARFHA